MAHPTFQMKRAYLAMRRCMEQALQPIGLTAAQFDVFQQLLHEDGLEHRLLQERLAIASPTLTNIIDGMVTRGLVERQVSAVDGRVKQLFLTPRAHELHDQLGVASQQFIAAMFAGFSPHERGLFLSWLDRVTDNLDPESTP
jgi:DNA-binding MarR family transcriptional regulator